MTEAIFVIIATASQIAINLISECHTALIKTISGTALLLHFVCEFSAVFLMRLIDKDKFKERRNEIIAQEDLARQSIELELLSNASQLKKDALQNGEWTNDHTQAIQAIGNALINQCGWDEDHVHQYLREVVEEGTGLTYISGMEEIYDEDDD